MSGIKKQVRWSRAKRNSFRRLTRKLVEVSEEMESAVEQEESNNFEDVDENIFDTTCAKVDQASDKVPPPNNNFQTEYREFIEKKTEVYPNIFLERSATEMMISFLLYRDSQSRFEEPVDDEAVDTWKSPEVVAELKKWGIDD